jgi:hypothetical protein
MSAPMSVIVWDLMQVLARKLKTDEIPEPTKSELAEHLNAVFAEARLGGNCPACGKAVRKRRGRCGPFLACTNRACFFTCDAC